MLLPLLLPLAALAGQAAPQAAVERHLMLGSAERVRIDGPFDVELVQGNPDVTISGPAAALTGVSVRVDANTLVVDTGTTGWQRRTRAIGGPVHVRITAQAIRTLLARGGARVHASGLTGARIDLSLEGAGTLAVEGLQADQLVATHTGMGLMTLAGSAGRARILGYGAAAVDASNLRADDAVLLWQSQGDLTVGVRYTAQVANNGQGRVTVTGAPQCRVSGTGVTACGTGTSAR
jgi:hypothetical protein